jgi:hypothetical protein
MQQIKRRKGTRYTCLTPNIKVSRGVCMPVVQQQEPPPQQQAW